MELELICPYCKQRKPTFRSLGTHIHKCPVRRDLEGLPRYKSRAWKGDVNAT